MNARAGDIFGPELVFHRFHHARRPANENFFAGYSLAGLLDEVGCEMPGLLVANPPYLFDAEAGAWQAELARLLGAGASGGQSLQWLVHGH